VSNNDNSLTNNDWLDDSVGNELHTILLIVDNACCDHHTGGNDNWLDNSLGDELHTLLLIVDHSCGNNNAGAGNHDGESARLLRVRTNCKSITDCAWWLWNFLHWKRSDQWCYRFITNTNMHGFPVAVHSGRKHRLYSHCCDCCGGAVGFGD
jgi:hypothetical protein